VAVFGRVAAAVTVVAFGSAVESWLVARIVSGMVLPIEHPVVFAAGLVATLLAMAGTSTIMAGAFVIARAGET
jgi:ABC-2 type transport system permease protein